MHNGGLTLVCGVWLRSRNAAGRRTFGANLILGLVVWLNISKEVVSVV